jgi:hypothetical protein
LAAAALVSATSVDIGTAERIYSLRAKKFAH